MLRESRGLQAFGVRIPVEHGGRGGAGVKRAGMGCYLPWQRHHGNIRVAANLPGPVAGARQVYIGEEGDVTCHGGSIMAFQKAWKSCPIQSWSGGCKLADMPGELKGGQNRVSGGQGPGTLHNATLQLVTSYAARRLQSCSLQRPQRQHP